MLTMLRLNFKGNLSDVKRFKAVGRRSVDAAGGVGTGAAVLAVEDLRSPEEDAPALDIVLGVTAATKSPVDFESAETKLTFWSLL